MSRRRVILYQAGTSQLLSGDDSYDSNKSINSNKNQRMRMWRVLKNYTNSAIIINNNNNNSNDDNDLN